MTGLIFFPLCRLGDMPMELTNTRGGSLSVGHPFGATGALIFLLYWYKSTTTGAEEALARVRLVTLIFLIYWYTSTNTDAEEAHARRAARHVGLGPP
jgi:hypothetical protein